MRLFSTIIVAAGLMLSAHADTSADPIAAEDLAPTAVKDVLPVWLPDGPTEISFNVTRQGKPFGSHNVVFEPTEEGGFTATTDVALKAKLGPITLYNYSHNSVETWKDGKFIGLESETRKEGDDLTATAKITYDGLLVEGTNYSGLYPATVIPANHWNISDLYARTILSTEGGQPLATKVVNLGRETLTIDGKDVEATKFRLDSDLSVFLWYDDDGKWVRLSLTARGQKVDYVLQEFY